MMLFASPDRLFPVIPRTPVITLSGESVTNGFGTYDAVSWYDRLCAAVSSGSVATGVTAMALAPRNATLAAANFLFRLLDLVGAGSATVLVPDCSAACTRDLLI